MMSGPRRLPMVALCAIALALAVSGRAPAQDPGDVSLGNVVNENDPNGPVASTMRELDAFHAKLVHEAPRVWIAPAIPVSNGLWPMGWTGGVDDPSGGAVAQGLRHTWTNIDTLANVQHIYRERRNERACRNIKSDVRK